MKKIASVLFILFFFIVGIINTDVIATSDNSYDLYVDGVKIESSDRVLCEEDEVLIPFRVVFEAMGSEVTWMECSTEDIFSDVDIVNKNVAGAAYFNYAGTDLALLLVQETADTQYFRISEAKNISSPDVANHILLNPWGSGGSYQIINNRIYISQYTAEYLFEALGCTLEIDTEKSTVKITQPENETPIMFVKDMPTYEESHGLIDVINRAELADIAMDIYESVMQDSSLAEEETECPFDDIDSSQYSDRIYQAYVHGFVQGTEERKFSPEKKVTCTEVVVVFDRIMQRINQERNIQPEKSEDVYVEEDFSYLPQWARKSFANVTTDRIVRYCNAEDYTEIITQDDILYLSENIKKYYLEKR